MFLDLTDLLDDVRREQRVRRRRQVRVARQRAAARRRSLLHAARHVRSVAQAFARRSAALARVSRAIESWHDSTREASLIQSDAVQYERQRIYAASTTIERSSAASASLSDHLAALAYRLDVTRRALRVRDARRFGG